MSGEVLQGARIVITGGSGFVGTHLRQLLKDRETRCIERAQLAQVELLTERLREARPTHIFHLAGVLGGAPGGYAMQHEANVLLTGNVLEAVVAAKLDPWIMVASSSAVYGATRPEENPLGEDRPLRPLTSYAASKAAQEMVALQYHLAHGLRTVRVRTFNLVGPGQPDALLASALTHQAVSAELDGTATMRVGNLFPKRDYTDVRDAVRAYVQLASVARGGEVYNVCSERSVSVQECLDLLLGLMSVPLRVEVDASRVRSVEIPDQVGDCRRLYERTGWTPAIPLALSFRDMLAFWRARVPVGSQVS